MRLLVIDNYDSFTWNLVHYLQSAGADVTVVRNDAVGVDEAVAGWEAIVISPGPGTPDGAGVTLDLVAACADAEKPLLGVCLGHQAIAQSFGARVVRAAKVMHGKTSAITHDGTGLFAGIASPMEAARYHSLMVDEAGLPSALLVTARADDGMIMGIAHRRLPIHGVQFHPESIATGHGHAMMANFLRECAGALQTRA